MSLRVLEVLPTLKRAGAEQVAVSLAIGLRDHACETRVVSLYDAFPGGFEPILAEAEVPVQHLGKRRGLDLRMISRLRKVFREFAPHIIHTHSYLLRYVLPAHAPLAHGRIVHTVHNVALREVDVLGRLVHRLAFRNGVIPIAVGPEVADSFTQVYPCAVAATIPNGIDIQRYRKPGQGDAWRTAHGFAPLDKLAVCVARLEPQKNPLGLVRAFHDALFPDASWHLVLAGEGSMRGEVERLVDALALRPRVHLLGLQSDVAPVLAAANLFVLASHWEGRPLAVMEALAAGLPVVATNVGGLPDLVADGDQGLLVPPGNLDFLAAALRTLAADQPRRDAMRASAWHVASRFSVDTMVASYADLFASLTGVPK